MGRLAQQHHPDYQLNGVDVIVQDKDEFDHVLTPNTIGEIDIPVGALGIIIVPHEDFDSEEAKSTFHGKQSSVYYCIINVFLPANLTNLLLYSLRSQG